MSAKFVWHRSDFFTGHLEEAVKTKTLGIARKVFEGVVDRTPVLTGSARASWNASVGEPIVINRINRDTLNPLGPPSFPLKSAPAFSKIYITNGVPYIMQLEYGSSKQAPQGMLRVTLASLGVKYGV